MNNETKYFVTFQPSGRTVVLNGNDMLRTPFAAWVAAGQHLPVFRNREGEAEGSIVIHPNTTIEQVGRDRRVIRDLTDLDNIKLTIYTSPQPLLATLGPPAVPVGVAGAAAAGAAAAGSVPRQGAPMRHRRGVPLAAAPAHQQALIAALTPPDPDRHQPQPPPSAAPVPPLPPGNPFAAIPEMMATGLMPSQPQPQPAAALHYPRATAATAATETEHIIPSLLQPPPLPPPAGAAAAGAAPREEEEEEAEVVDGGGPKRLKHIKSSKRRKSTRRKSTRRKSTRRKSTRRLRKSSKKLRKLSRKKSKSRRRR